MMTFLLKQEALLSVILVLCFYVKQKSWHKYKADRIWEILSPPAYGEVSYCNFLNVYFLTFFSAEGNISTCCLWRLALGGIEEVCLTWL